MMFISIFRNVIIITKLFVIGDNMSSLSISSSSRIGYATSDVQADIEVVIKKALADESATTEEIVDWLLDYCEKQDLEESLIGEKVFTNERVFDYLSAETPLPKLDHLKRAFPFFWSQCRSLDDITLNFLKTLIHRIYPQDKLYADQFVREKVAECPYTAVLDFRILSLLDALSPDTEAFLEKEMRRFSLNDPSFAEKVEVFLKDSKHLSLTLWKYSADDQLRHIPLICKGTQINGSKGSVHLSAAKKVAEQLNQRAPSSVEFKLGEISDQMSGGSCTAMCMRLLRLYREERNQQETCVDTLRKVGEHILIASSEYRDIQAACNSIQKKAASVDFKKDKVEALLKFENPTLTVIHSFDEVTLQAASALSQLTQQWNSFPEGIFFVRSLHPTQLEDPAASARSIAKEEVCGHSALLFREKGETFYYDPAMGVVQLYDPKQLQLILEWQNFRWDLPCIRVYRLSS